MSQSIVLFSRNYLPFQSFALAASKTLINVLNQVDEYPCLYFNKEILHEAICRYEHLWIPLLLSQPPRDRLLLVPPIDIEWVWLCHMLCPRQYITDCTAMCGEVIDHVLLTTKLRETWVVESEKLWSAKYSEPFHIRDKLSNAPLISGVMTDDEVWSKDSKIKYDITAAAARQMDFHYQVGVMPHYLHKKSFLKAAVRRYNMFLKLKRKHRTEVLVPTFDIDIMWHTHMLHPSKYAKKTSKIMGRKGSILPHDDTLNSRKEGSDLETQWEITRHLWYCYFSRRKPLETEGGMWRGNVSMEERNLRQKIGHEIKNIGDDDVDGLLKCKISSDESVHEHLNMNEWKKVDWVHAIDLKRYAEKCDAQVLESFTECDSPFVRRLSSLSPTRLVGSVTSFNPLKLGIPGSTMLPTVIEIFSKSTSWKETTCSSIPLASATFARPGSIFRPAWKYHKYEKRRYATLLLRVGGIDIGILAGRWDGFELPRGGVRETPSHKYETGTVDIRPKIGRPGNLKLRFFDLRKNSESFNNQWEELKSKSNGEALPGTFKLKEHVSFNLSTGVVTVTKKDDIVLAYLLCLSAAAMHVGMQPRYKPLEEGKSTMYPPWECQQTAYETLMVSGGEKKLAEETGGRKVGVGNVMAECENWILGGLYVDSIDGY